MRRQTRLPGGRLLPPSSVAFSLLPFPDPDEEIIVGAAEDGWDEGGGSLAGGISSFYPGGGIPLPPSPPQSGCAVHGLHAHAVPSTQFSFLLLLM